MPEGMIERIARQLCVAARIDPDKHVPRKERGLRESWSAWMAFREEARAILHTMREPTRAMVRAVPGEYGDAGWAAMIDAALAEHQP